MTTIEGLEAHGIPVTALADGGLVETKTVVHDAGQLRSLLDQGLDQQGRQAHFEALFNGIQPPPPRAGRPPRTMKAVRPCPSASQRTWSATPICPMRIRPRSPRPSR